MIETHNIGINFGALSFSGSSLISMKSLAFKELDSQQMSILENSPKKHKNLVKPKPIFLIEKKRYFKYA